MECFKDIPSERPRLIKSGIRRIKQGYFVGPPQFTDTISGLKGRDMFSMRLGKTQKEVRIHI